MMGYKHFQSSVWALEAGKSHANHPTRAMISEMVAKVCAEGLAIRRFTLWLVGGPDAN